MAAAAGDLDAPVPTCPGWRLRDLLRHTGGVHRWAAAHVSERRARPVEDAEEAALFTAAPGDAALLDWLRAGHAALVQTLEPAEPRVACWAFLPAPSPLAFWARRQAHETGVRRADAEGIRGRITFFPPALAADGIDELLFGFVNRPRGTLHPDPARSLRFLATDAGRAWRCRWVGRR